RALRPGPRLPRRPPRSRRRPAVRIASGVARARGLTGPGPGPITQAASRTTPHRRAPRAGAPRHRSLLFFVSYTAVDILAVAAHPDDVELTCGGALLRAAAMGRRTAVLDLTAGETGTRGTPAIRAAEATAAAAVLGL